jgi:hypothetical protein
MKRIAAVLLLLVAVGCSVRRLESSKAYYAQARAAQEAGNDLQAVLYWKQVQAAADREIAAGHFLATNYFLRSSAYIELGDWEKGFADLKQISPDSLSNEELWIYPLCSVLTGDAYAQKNMPMVAAGFYQSVLKKSNLKASSVYMLALERQVNNSIRMINNAAGSQKDPEGWKTKQYADLSKDLQKYIEDYPFSSVPHFLMGDLYLKQHKADEALQYILASLEMGLPTQDLKRSAEFEIVSLLSDYTISDPLKATLLGRAQEWWKEGSLLTAGENTVGWAQQQEGFVSQFPPAARIRYLGVLHEGKTRILAWEKL